MKKFVITLLLTTLTASVANADTIKIGGSGSMIPMLTALGKAYVKKNPKDSVEVNQKSMGQPGGIAALNAGAVDIAMSAMPISAEQSKLAVEPFEIAKVAGVIAVNSSVTATSLTSQQLCDIYTGKIRNWKQVGGVDAPISAFTRPESDSTKMMFRKAFACMNTLKEAGDIINIPKSADMFTSLSNTKNSIGPVDSIALGDAAGKFKEIKIDGKGHDQMTSGGWQFVLKNNLVLGKNRGEAVKRFMSFVKSPEGQAVIKSEKAVPTQFKF